MMNLPAVDKRARVRLWNKDYTTCLADERVQPGETPTQVIERALRKLNIVEAQAVLDHKDWRDRRSAYVWFNQEGNLETLDHHELIQYIMWPTNPLLETSD